MSSKPIPFGACQIAKLKHMNLSNTQFPLYREPISQLKVPINKTLTNQPHREMESRQGSTPAENCQMCRGVGGMANKHAACTPKMDVGSGGGKRAIKQGSAEAELNNYYMSLSA